MKQLLCIKAFIAAGWNVEIKEGSVCTWYSFDANRETPKERTRGSNYALIVNKIPITMHVPEKWLNEHFG